MGAPPLLERDAELAALDELLMAAAAGEGRLALVEGPAGIGKSRLLGAARERAGATRARVLTARGSELELPFAFGVVRQLFEHAGASLEGAAAPAAAVLASAPQDEGAAPSFAVLHGLYWVALELAAERPLVLAIDDLHWCDQPSLRFLVYLAQRLDGIPVLVVATLRAADPGLLAELARGPATVRLRPRALSEEAVGALLADRLADPAVAAACHEATGGNPLLLSELVAALASAQAPPDAETVRRLGATAASEAVLHRLGGLAEPAGAIATALAVLGEGAPLHHVAALAGVDERAAAAALAELARVEIVGEAGFTHPVVEGAVYRAIPPGERDLLHAEAADLLAATGAPVERVAVHLRLAPSRGREEVVDVLWEAARVARRRGAADSAAAFLRRALDEPPPSDRRAQLLLELSEAEALTDGRAAMEHLAAAHDAVTDPRQRAEVAVMRVRVLTMAGRTVEAAELGERALADVPPGEADLAHRLEAAYLNVGFLDPSMQPLRERARAYRECPLRSGAGARQLAALAAYDWAHSGGPRDACVALARAALGDGPLPEGGAGPFVGCFIVLALADEPDAVALHDRALADAHRAGSVLAAAGAQVFRSHALLLRGDLADAEAAVRAALDDADVWGVELGRSTALVTLADILAERGDVAGAAGALSALGVPDDPPDVARVQAWLGARARVLLLEDRPEPAMAVAERAARGFEAMGGANPAFMPWRSLRALALDRLGRTDEAIVAMADEIALARAWGAPRTLGRALRVRGTLRRGDGLVDLEEAVAVLSGSPARLEHAKALLALGTTLRLARRPSDAREPLRAALDLADACGAEPTAERTRTELLAAGARPRRDALKGVGALTPSERRVAALAAAGRSNRDIAQELFVTPKTVELHLTNAYRKLDIGSRRDLPGALGA